MISLLATYGQWVLVAACIASLAFAVATTFLETNGRHFRLRLRFFPWWQSELTLAQVVLDLCLFILLLPSSLDRLTGIDLLRATSGSLASLWYYATGVTLITAVTIWRTDATIRAKGRQRRRRDS